MIGTAGLALAVARSSRRVGLEPVIAAAGVVLLIEAPAQSLALGFFTWAVVRFRRAAARARAERDREAAAIEAGELVALGLAGGFSVAAAHRAALDHCDESIRPDLALLCWRMARDGVVAGLDADTGPMAPGSAALVTATASGAPVLPALEAHLRQVHHARHMAAVEAMRRLPIRLLIPLTLLVLPGFVLVTVGPAVIDSLARLGP